MDMTYVYQTKNIGIFSFSTICICQLFTYNLFNLFLIILYGNQRKCYKVWFHTYKRWQEKEEESSANVLPQTTQLTYKILSWQCSFEGKNCQITSEGFTDRHLLHFMHNGISQMTRA